MYFFVYVCVLYGMGVLMCIYVFFLLHAPLR